MNYKIRTINLSNSPVFQEMEYSDDRVPLPKIENKHWKVGDGMDGLLGKFIIGQIAVVQLEPNRFAIAYYDQKGRLQGEQRMRLETSKKGGRHTE